MPYEQARTVAINAVLQACHLCRQVQQNLTADQHLAKSDASPVTVADFGAQALIISQLLAAFPGDPVVGEEDASLLRQDAQQSIKDTVIRLVNDIQPDLNGDLILDAIDYGARSCDFTQRYWTLDPIDGTKGFLRGEQYAVALALVEHGEPVLGVLGCPNLPEGCSSGEPSQGCLAIAIKGQGAVVRGFEDPAETPIHVNEVALPKDARFCDSVEAAHASHEDHSKIAKLLGITRCSYRIDSQCKYAVVARGDASIYLRLTKTPDYRAWIWDHAAGVLIVQEAGGTVTDMYGKSLDFSTGRRLLANSGVVATNGLLHDRVIDAVKRIR